ncbi:MAG: helix-turn-helix transcriptional regulator [Nitrosomonadales bacterium]|nr:helix-turn-helix transcriptional regulator [Nitrosomonadales bacterium]
MMPYTIQNVTVLPNLTLHLSWAAGGHADVQLADVIGHTRGLLALREPAAFALASVGEDGLSVAWPNDLEISARRLWQLAAEQTGDSRAEFRDWLQRNHLTLASAAEVLGLTRRTISQYSSGARPLPKTVHLALKGFEAEKRAA